MSDAPSRLQGKRNPLIRRMLDREALVSHQARAEFLRQATENPELFHADLDDIVRVIAGNRKRDAIIATVLIVSSYPLMMASPILAAVPHFETIANIFPLFSGVIPASGLLALGVLNSMAKRDRRQLAACIAGIDDLNALPRLIELLEFTNPAIQSAILPPITRLLSRLRPSDASLLRFAHRTALARTLSSPGAQKFDVSFFLAVLQAFEQIGDSQVLPAVAWLAQGKGKAGAFPELRTAAQRCETHLQERLRLQQAPEMLLRASSATGTPEMLLRPIASAPNSLPEELLRPTSTTTQDQQIALGLALPTAEAEPMPLRLQGHEDR